MCIREINSIDLPEDVINCHIACLVKIFKVLKIDYTLLFLPSMFFNIIPQNPQNSENLLGTRIEAREWYSSMHCILSTNKRFDICEPILDMEKLINDVNFPNGPFLVGADVYNCPWAALYHKTHLNHAFVSLKYYDNNAICCFDPYSTSDVQIIQREDLKKIASQIAPIAFSEINLCVLDIQNIIMMQLDEYKKKSKGSIKSWGDIFFEEILVMNIEDELRQSYMYYGVYLIRVVKEIADGRLGLAYTFSSLIKNGMQVSHENIDKLLALYNSWNSIKLLLLKLLMRKNLTGIENPLRQTIFYTFDLEQSLVDGLQKDLRTV